MDMLFVFPSYLIIVRTTEDNIFRYNVLTQKMDKLNTTGYSPQDASVDGNNEVIYWVNFDSDNSEFRIMSTTYANETTDLGIAYDDGSRIRIDQDQLHLYIFDISNDTIGKYVKSTWERVENIVIPDGSSGFEIAFGKSSYDQCNRNRIFYCAVGISYYHTRLGTFVRRAFI